MLRLVLLASFIFTAAPSLAAGNLVLVPGDKVTLIGKFVSATGEDVKEQLVSYQAIKLDKPIDIKTESGVFENITHLKLWLDRMPPNTFSKNRNVLLKVTGEIDYYWFGPSTFINPAKFEVTNIERLH